MADSREEIASVVVGHMVDIMSGSCRIDDDLIQQHSDDPMVAEILTGLLYLNQDLRLKESRLVRAEELEAAVTKLNKTTAELWSEIDLARKIQTTLLPAEPRVHGYDVAALMHPASDVGGDYYDVFRAGDADWVLIGDVSGHGVSAGLIMMMVQTAVRALVLNHSAAPLSPARVLAMVNAAVYGNLEKIGRGQFMTVTALSIRDGVVTHAGRHQDILVHRASTGEIQPIATSGIWLGLMPNVEALSRDETFKLDRGDTMLLFTDGITESRPLSVGDEMLGVEGLAALFRRAVEAKPSCNARTLLTRIVELAAGYRTDDDVTLLALRA
jgi:serine phosphatase RsbU (regulator of sigma subunit)